MSQPTPPGNNPGFSSGAPRQQFGGPNSGPYRPSGPGPNSGPPANRPPFSGGPGAPYRAPGSSPGPGTGPGAPYRAPGSTSGPPGNRPNSPFDKRRPRVETGPRRNDRIRAQEVRVLDPDGKMLGVMDIDHAISTAKQYGLDLIEISPNAVPPVCRIADFGKFLYEQNKREKETRQKQTAAKLKEVKLRVRIDPHDLLIKLRHAELFLFHGDKVKISLQLRFRETSQAETAIEVVKKAVADLAHVSHSDFVPRLNGRSVVAMLSPVPEQKRKLKLNEKGASVHDAKDDTGEEEDDDES